MLCEFSWDEGVCPRAKPTSVLGLDDDSPARYYQSHCIVQLGTLLTLCSV